MVLAWLIHGFIFFCCGISLINMHDWLMLWSQLDYYACSDLSLINTCGLTSAMSHFDQYILFCLWFYLNQYIYIYGFAFVSILAWPNKVFYFYHGFGLNNINLHFVMIYTGLSFSNGLILIQIITACPSIPTLSWSM